MLNIDWGLLQLQYELLGASVEELAEEYNTTTRMIEYAADERNWKRAPLAVATQDFSQLKTVEGVTENLLEDVQKRMLIMRSLKQSALGPRYISLETALLGKCLEFLKNLAADDPNNAPVLRTVSDILKSLKEQTHGSVKDEKDANKALTVNVMTKVGGGNGGSTEPTKVTVQGKELPDA